VGGDPCEELERVQFLEVAPEAGIELGVVEDLASGGIEGELLKRERGAGDVAGEGLEGLGLVGLDAHRVV